MTSLRSGERQSDLGSQLVRCAETSPVQHAVTVRADEG